MAYPARTVDVNGNKYEFYLISGQKAFKASRKLMAKASCLLPCFAKGEVSQFNEKLNELILDDFDELLETFIDKNQLRCNGELIMDFDEHFAGRFTEIPQLLYKVILENDRDFFHYLPTLIQKGLATLNEKLQANSLKMPNGVEEALTKTATSIKENLG